MRSNEMRGGFWGFESPILRHLLDRSRHLVLTADGLHCLPLGFDAQILKAPAWLKKATGRNCQAVSNPPTEMDVFNRCWQMIVTGDSR